MTGKFTTTAVVVLLPVFLGVVVHPVPVLDAKLPTGILIVGQQPSQIFDPATSPHTNGAFATGLLPAMQYGTGTLMPYAKMFFVKGVLSVRVN